MSSTTTVAFADLTGSTGLFEALGNAKATATVTSLTQWISKVCEHNHGRVVKTLGDGVLALFPDGPWAVTAMVELQRRHLRRTQNWPEAMKMSLQIGLACGEIVQVEGDCYGDAVNVASRLSDLSGGDQIWATDSVIEQIVSPQRGVRLRNLGPVSIRGKAEPRVIYRIEWQEEVMTEHLTAPASLDMMRRPSTTQGASISLAWLDTERAFPADSLPIHLGRVREADFVVEDQRVSRLHARISWHNNNFIVSDLSSFGTWVRFATTLTEQALRRQDAVLHGQGELALGAPFSDFTVPTVSFSLAGS